MNPIRATLLLALALALAVIVISLWRLHPTAPVQSPAPAFAAASNSAPAFAPAPPAPEPLPTHARLDIPGPVRDAADATARAVHAANAAAHADYSTAPFTTNSAPAAFDGQYWSWHSRVACGRGDLEGAVLIATNGALHKIDLQLEMSEPRASGRGF